MTIHSAKALPAPAPNSIPSELYPADIKQFFISGASPIANKRSGVKLSGPLKNFDIPIMAGGVTPTMSPYVCIENPNIDMIIQNEGEIPIKELCLG